MNRDANVDNRHGVGWGRGGRGFPSPSLAPTLLLSLTYTPFCPSLSICLSASFLLWLSISPSPHPLVCLFFSGQGSRTPCLAPRQPPSWEWKQGVQAHWDQALQGLGRGWGTGVGGAPACRL